MEYKLQYNISEVQIDPQNDLTDFVVTTQDGRRLHGDAVTPSYVRQLMNKYQESGENANGAYFAEPGMVVVREITEPCIRSAVEDLAKRNLLETVLVDEKEFS